MMRYTLLFLVLLHSTFTSGSSPSQPRWSSQSNNEWELGDLYFQRSQNKTAPFPIAAKFNLYRSYYNDCRAGPGSFIGYVSTGRICGKWVIPDTPIECSEGIKMGYSGEPPWVASSKSGWFSCDKSLNVPQADQEISEEKKKRLRWQLYDVQERNSAGTAPEKQFISAKLEVVNGIPIKS
jgi:hypothetical protein